MIARAADAELGAERSRETLFRRRLVIPDNDAEIPRRACVDH